MGERWRRALQRAQAWFSKPSLQDLLPIGDAIFLHRPHGQPCHGITREIIKDFDHLSELILSGHNTKRYSLPADVTLVTYNNRPFKSRIELCYEACGINEFVVL